MALNELSPFCSGILGRRDAFRNTVANRLARGELISEEEVIRAPRPGYLIQIGPDQSVLRQPDGTWKRYTFAKPQTRWTAPAAHWLTYRKDYLMVLALIALYLIAIQVAQP